MPDETNCLHAGYTPKSGESGVMPIVLLRPLPQEGEIWQHFKNKQYRIVTLAIHSETDELQVVYKALYGEGKTYVRPLAMFMNEVDSVKYPNVQQKYRFVHLEKK